MKLIHNWLVIWTNQNSSDSSYAHPWCFSWQTNKKQIISATSWLFFFSFFSCASDGQCRDCVWPVGTLRPRLDIWERYRRFVNLLQRAFSTQLQFIQLFLCYWWQMETTLSIVYLKYSLRTSVCSCSNYLIIWLHALMTSCYLEAWSGRGPFTQHMLFHLTVMFIVYCSTINCIPM